MESRNGHPSSPRWWQRFRRRPVDDDMATYRRVALQLHCDLVSAGGRNSVLIVTPARSSVSARVGPLLAASAAEELHRPILLVDACPGDPELTRTMGCPGSPGLGDAWDRTSPWEAHILPTSLKHVSFLPAGTPAARPAAVEQFVQGAESRYGLVIFCGGCVLDDSLIPLLAPHIGCALLAITENQTRVPDLEAAEDALHRFRAPRIGVLMTSDVRGRKLAPAPAAARSGAEETAAG